MANQLTGIKPRGNSIRINFVFEGKRYFETLNLSPTPANIKQAALLRRDIKRRIRQGTFDYREFFPESGRADITSRPTFGAMAEAWLESKRRELAPTTLGEYRNVTESYFGNIKPRVMAEISFLELSQLMAGLKVSNKTYNNILSVLRGVYVFGLDAGAVTVNHAAKLNFVPKGEPRPDPLSLEEAGKVLQDMQTHYPEPMVIYFRLAIRLGFRPSEGIDLRWENVDWVGKLLKIQSAKVRSIVKSTKTEKVRWVELSNESIELLKRMHQYTGKSTHLFLHPNTGKPFASTAWMVQQYWRPSLARCGFHDRDARQTRHTCATIMLMSGARDRWAAEQLGHSVAVFQKIYSKWLPDNDRGRELAKASEMFARLG